MIVKVINIATDGDGAFVGTLAVKTPAKLYAAQWIKGTQVNGVDATLICTQFSPRSLVTTLLALTNANADALYYPRVAAADGVGAAIADAYQAPLVHGTLQLTIAQGGATKTGALWLYLEG